MLKEKSLEVFTKKTKKQSTAFSFNSKLNSYIGCGRYMIEVADNSLPKYHDTKNIKKVVTEYFKNVLEYRTFFELDMDKLLRYLKAFTSNEIELNVENRVLKLYDCDVNDYISFYEPVNCDDLEVVYNRKELINILTFLKQNTLKDKRKVTFCFDVKHQKFTKSRLINLKPTCLITETVIKAIVAPVRLAQ